MLFLDDHALPFNNDFKTRMDALKYSDLWKPLKIEQDETLSIQLGSLNLWIHRGNTEWHIASTYRPDEPQRLSITRAGTLPEQNWTRWIINEQVDEVILNPQMPDRPLIVRPEMPICLMPRQSVHFYIGVPIWVSVSLGKRIRNIAEIPAVELSNSWFGPVTEGELCYAMRTTAKLRQEALLPHPHRAVVPLEIRNTSEEKLDFERLCLHAKSLMIYQGHERMWTNKGRVSYRGEEKWSRIVYARSAPPYDGADQLIGRAREPVERGALLKTFDNWKNFADF